MLKRSNYIALGIVVVITLILLNLPTHTTARLKVAVSSLFLPLFGLANTTDQAANKAGDMITTRRSRRLTPVLRIPRFQQSKIAVRNLPCGSSFADRAISNQPCEKVMFQPRRATSREKTDKRGVHGKRLRAALDDNYLLKILNS